MVDTYVLMTSTHTNVLVQDEGRRKKICALIAEKNNRFVFFFSSKYYLRPTVFYAFLDIDGIRLL